MNNWLKEHPVLASILSIVGLVTLFVILIFVVFRITVPLENMDDMGILISFIGVIGTFVVIGNFAQTSRIENSMDDKIIKLNDRIKVCEENDKNIPSINNALENHSADILKAFEMINALDLAREEMTTPVSRQDLARLLKLFIGKESDIRKYMQLYARMLDPKSKYYIELVNGEKVSATLSYDKNTHVLLFLSSANMVIEAQHIRNISGLPFKQDDILYAYHLLCEMKTLDIETHEDETNKEDYAEEKGDH